MTEVWYAFWLDEFVLLTEIKHEHVKEYKIEMKGIYAAMEFDPLDIKDFYFIGYL